MSKGQINVYECPKGHKTVTIDADEGVTPFMLRCKSIACNKQMAISQFYRVDQSLRPDWEWYKPDKAEYDTLDEATVYHVDKGGLLLRKLDASGRERHGY